MENVGASVGEEPMDEEPTLFKQVVYSLKPDHNLSSCIFKTQGGGSQMG